MGIPGVSNTTRLAAIPTTTDGTGWMVDPVGGATGFPAGNWSFTVVTDIPNGTFVAGGGRAHGRALEGDRRRLGFHADRHDSHSE